MTAPFETVTFTSQQHGWDYDSYDKTVARLFNALTLVNAAGVPTAKPVPLIFATPDRAWATMRKKFEKDIERDREFRIPLPFISLQQIGDTAYDPRRYLYKKILYRRVALDTDDYRTCLSHAKPLPFTFQYAAELWVKTRYEARVNGAQFSQLFDEGGMAYRKVDHGYPIGPKWIPFFLDSGISDNSNLDAGDQERSLRFSMTIRVEGWLAPPLITQHLVHEMNVVVDMPEDGVCGDNIYDNGEVAYWSPLQKGNPDTGEIVEGQDEFTDPYVGPDYRVARFSVGNPCVDV